MQDIVQSYYGKELSSTQDLKTSACCDATKVPDWLKPLLSKVHFEVCNKYYGCGLVCPPLLQGAKVLDLGCGVGRDVYLLAQLVGASGEVVGVDMTKEQLQVAEEYKEYHAKLFGYSNVCFLEGKIEELEQLDLEPGSFDVIVSNCVLNLSVDKQAVLNSVHKLLKPGGEFYFSDVYVNRRLPEDLRAHPVLYGECLGGALYWKDFLRMSTKAGFQDARLVEDKPIEITLPSLQKLLGENRFYSATYRLFKIEALEDACEDFGQAVIYLGTIPDHPFAVALDGHHFIETGKVFSVCGNTFRMLHETRYAPHFQFIGNFDRHFGLYPGCGGAIPFKESTETSSSCC